MFVSLVGIVGFWDWLWMGRLLLGFDLFIDCLLVILPWFWIGDCCLLFGVVFTLGFVFVGCWFWFPRFECCLGVVFWLCLWSGYFVGVWLVVFVCWLTSYLLMLSTYWVWFSLDLWGCLFGLFVCLCLWVAGSYRFCWGVLLCFGLICGDSVYFLAGWFVYFKLFCYLHVVCFGFEC